MRIILQILFFSTILFCGITTKANTVLGGNITWTCLGGDQYQIRLTSYLDCYGYDFSGGSIPAVESVLLIPNGCGSSPFSTNLTYTSHTEISELCPTELPFSSCSGGANQGVAQFIYEATVTIPAGCQWSVVWSNYYWGYFINSNEFSNPSYIHSVIDTNFPCSSSPTIVSTPAAPQVPFVCAGVVENHTLNIAGLPAGYTVEYSILPNLVFDVNNPLAPPSNANGWTIPTGLGSPNPASGSGGTTISWTPTMSSITTNGIRVEIKIFDASNNHVGTINENMVFYVRDCVGTDTHFTSPAISSTGSETSLSGGNNISVCAGDSLIFTASAVNSNALRAITINHTPIANLPLTVSQDGLNPANKTFKLLTTSAHVGSYTLNIEAIDDACPNPDTDNTTVNITVHPNVKLTFSDTTICAGNNIQLVAEGLSNNAYTWSVVSGDSNFNPTANSATQTVSPSETTVYKVSGSGIPAACQSEDNVTVHVLMSNLTYTKADETCGNNNGSITLAIVGETTGNMTYTWSPTTGGITQGVSNQSGLSGGASYSVVVAEPVYGCTLNASIAIGDIPEPTLSFTGTTTICEGDCTDLTINLTQGSSPFSITATNISGTLTGLTSPHVVQVCPTSNTTYSITGVTDASSCTATVSLNVTVTVRPRVTGAFDAAGPICLGDNLNLNVNYTPSGGNYNVFYTATPPSPGIPSPLSVSNFSGGNIAMPTPASPGVYTYKVDSVAYTNAPTCPGINTVNPSINVTVNPLPTATISGGNSSVCNGECKDLNIALTGTGPWTVTYTANGINPQTLSIASSPYTWQVCPANTTTYCITAVQDANCTNSNMSNECTTITVIAPPVINSYTVGDADICTGEGTTLNVSFGPSGQDACLFFTATPADALFLPPFCSQPSSAQFSSSVTPTVNTVYCLDSIYFENAPQCATIVSICRSVNVHEAISGIATDTICNSTSTQYQITYTLSNGVLPYSLEAGSSAGAFNPAGSATFTTGWINSGAAGSWAFSDVNTCNTLTMTANHTCPVLTEAGTMNNSSPINVCGSGQATAVHNGDEFLDGNDELMFILYTNSANPLAAGSVIQQNCATPAFGFITGMSYGTTYYIAAVAGDEGSVGCVDLTAANVQVSNGVSITWYETPTATLSAPGATSACIGNCVNLNIALTGQGPWTITYTVDGAAGASSPIVIPANTTSPYSFCSQEDGTHELTAVESGSGVGLCPGTVNGTVDVTIHPLPTAVFSGNGSTCVGIDHCFDITLTGTAPWNIEIDNPGSTNANANGIASSPYNSYCVGEAGNYQIVSVTDANSCTNTSASTVAILTVHQLPTVQWTLPDTSYCQGSSITLPFAISQGFAPFNVEFDSPDADIANMTGVTAVNSIVVDVAGTHQITSVTDANNCTSTTGDSIEIIEIATPVVDAGGNLDQCLGTPITIGTAAVPGQTYSWSPDTGIAVSETSSATPTVLIGNSPVTIQYTVTAYVGQCSASDIMTLTMHGLPSVSISSLSDTLCFQACTDLQANNNGTGTLTYEWGTSASISNTDLTDNPITVCPGSNEIFSVTAFETHGSVTCESSATKTIVAGTELVSVENYTEEVCNGTCEGEITIAPSGGFSPYSISGDLTTFSTTNLCPGTYNYVIEDAVGCTLTGSIIITERAPEVIDDITVTQPSCVYDLGEIQVNNSYTSYQISGNCGNINTNPNTSGLFSNIPPCATPYTITASFQVSPTEFCTTTTTVFIQAQSPAISFNPDWEEDTFCYNEQACFGGNPVGGTGALDIRWYDCPSLNTSCEVSTSEPYCLPITHDNTFYGVATDALGCKSDTAMVVAHLAPTINLVVQNGAPSAAICQLDCLDITAQATGGNNNITIEWFEVPNTSIGTGAQLNVCPMDTTTYYAIARDGCSEDKTDTLDVVVHTTPIAQIDADNYSGCYPQTINFIDLSSTVSDNHTCIWNFGNGATSTLCGDASVTYEDYGVFMPTYTIMTEYGCSGQATLNNPIIVYGKPQVGFTWEPDPVTVINNRVQFTNTSLAAASYVWSVQGVGTSIKKDPEFILPPKDQSTIEVCLEATTVNGCKDTLCQEIFMETVLQIYVPNAFTPDFEDSNKINDVFLPIITGHDPDRYKIWILNRWGDTVFFSTDHTAPWVGNFDGGSDFVPDGSYVWHIECYELGSNDMEVYQGIVTIIR